jgi:hypothetical protein
MYMTFTNMLIQLFSVLGLLVSIPIIITSSIQYASSEDNDDDDDGFIDLSDIEYDASILNMLNSIAKYIANTAIKNVINNVQKSYDKTDVNAGDIFVCCNLLGIIYTIGYSIQVRKKLESMSSKQHKNRETPGNFTVLMRDITLKGSYAISNNFDPIKQEESRRHRLNKS